MKFLKVCHLYRKDYLQDLRRGLANFGGPLGRALAMQLANYEAQQRAKQAERMPESRGNVGAIVGEPFFVPLEKLFKTYGGVFRLTFGPKVTISCRDDVLPNILLSHIKPGEEF
jgi:hypothetical protein